MLLPLEKLNYSISGYFLCAHNLFYKMGLCNLDFELSIIFDELILKIAKILCYDDNQPVVNIIDIAKKRFVPLLRRTYLIS